MVGLAPEWKTIPYDLVRLVKAIDLLAEQVNIL